MQRMSFKWSQSGRVSGSPLLDDSFSPPPGVCVVTVVDIPDGVAYSKVAALVEQTGIVPGDGRHVRDVDLGPTRIAWRFTAPPAE